MARIYTRGGDAGRTGLIGNRRVAKSDPRVELYGTLDELNGWLGEAAARLGGESDLAGELRVLQSRLFDLGALLADPDRCAAGDAPSFLDTAPLENDIDRHAADLPPLKTFILPGGCPAAAALHLARAVCRRAERLAVGAAAGIDVPAPAIAYLNRLGDYLFVAARVANRSAGVADVPWRPDSGE